MNLMLTRHGDELRILVNWNNVCYVESQGDDGEDLHARVHFSAAAGMASMSVEVVEDIEDIASLLEAANEAVVELNGEDEDDGDEKGDDKG